MSDIFISEKLPVLALRGLAVFPDQSVHFDIGRAKSALALEAAMKANQLLMLVPQKNIIDDDPDMNALFPIGTVVKVKQILKAHGDNIRVLVSGLYRCRITDLTQFTPYLSGVVERVSDVHWDDTLRTRALRRDANALYGQYMEFLDHPAQSMHLRMIASNDCGFIADAIAQNSGIEYSDKAKLLCQLNPVKRLEKAIQLLQVEIQMLQMEADIQEKTRMQWTRSSVIITCGSSLR